MNNLPKSYLNRPLTTCICYNCGKEVVKPFYEVFRNEIKGRKNFCSRKCACKYMRTLQKDPTEKQLENQKNIKNYCGNKRDKYSPFRYVLRKIKARKHEVNVDLEYLFNLWQEQNGICPYTNIKLQLHEENQPKIPFECQASLDRIDSSKGYIKGNVQWVSLPINLMKSKMSDQQTKNYIKLIVDLHDAESGGVDPHT